MCAASFERKKLLAAFFLVYLSQTTNLDRWVPPHFFTILSGRSVAWPLFLPYIDKYNQEKVHFALTLDAICELVLKST